LEEAFTTSIASTAGVNTSEVTVNDMEFEYATRSRVLSDSDGTITVLYTIILSSDESASDIISTLEDSVSGSGAETFLEVFVQAVFLQTGQALDADSVTILTATATSTTVDDDDSSDSTDEVSLLSLLGVLAVLVLLVVGAASVYLSKYCLSVGHYDEHDNISGTSNEDFQNNPISTSRSEDFRDVYRL